MKAPAGRLERVVVVVHTLEAEAPNVSAFSLLLALGRRLGPAVVLEALDSEEFFGVTLESLGSL